ncbi:MAG TPA: hypothetical protein VGL91_06045 [Acidobacteriota bacterium]
MTLPNKTKKRRFNLDSPTAALSPCSLEKLQEWVDFELSRLRGDSIRKTADLVCKDLDEFVKWPEKAALLLPGCTREKRYHVYPDQLKVGFKERKICCDTRANGPAIAAYLWAGGERPERFGSFNKWSVHHVYSGKFPYPCEEKTLHAPKDGNHFTQSAGLVAVHPVADAMADEFPFFSWLLRAKAFVKFGYDPDAVLTDCGHDQYGFAVGFSTEVVHQS